jgi:hypothetical protein
MNYLERLNAKFKEAVKNQCEMNANKRLAKQAQIKLKGQIADVELRLEEARDSMEDLKDSKDFSASALWKKQKEIMLLEKEMEFYFELQKEMF